MKWIVAASIAVGLSMAGISGCTQVRELACADTSPRCPPGSYCADGVCVFGTPDASSPPDASSDGGNVDGGNIDGGRVDDGGVDATLPDAFVPPDSCGGREVCNGIDDDCDPSTPDGSGQACSSMGGTGTCTAGACVIVCDMMHSDCDFDASNGCETPGTFCEYGPRHVYPLTSMVLNTNAPELHFELLPQTDRAVIDVCTDRDCSTAPVATFTTSTSPVVVPPLAPGTYYWRTRGILIGHTAPEDTHRLAWRFDTYLPVSAPSPAVVTTAYPMLSNGTTPETAIGQPTAMAFRTIRDIATAPASSPTIAIRSSSFPGFGAALSTVDINGDGLTDVIVGGCVGTSPPTGTPTTNCTENAWVYSGVIPTTTGLGDPIVGMTPLTTTFGTTHDGFGFAVAGIGDFDGDGFGDYAVGSYAANLVTIYFGAPLDFRRFVDVLPSDAATTGFGIAVASAGDVDGDRRDDLLIGSTSNDLHIVHFDASTGGTVSERITGVPSRSVTGVGDMDGDGYSDMAAGSGWDAPSLSFAVFFGSDTRTYASSAAMTGTGLAVMGAGDVDGNGHTDLVASSPTELTFFGASAARAVGSFRRYNPPVIPTGYGRWLGRAGTPTDPWIVQGSVDSAVGATTRGTDGSSMVNFRGGTTTSRGISGAGVGASVLH